MVLTPEQQAEFEAESAREAEALKIEYYNDQQSEGATVGDFLQTGADFATGGLPAVLAGAFDPFDSPGDVQDPAANAPPPMRSMGDDALGALAATKTREDLLNPPSAKKAGGRGSVGSISMELHRPVPQALADEQVQVARARTELRATYQSERAKSLGILVDFGTEMAHGYKTNFEKTAKQIDSLLDEAELEKNAIGELIERAESNTINPGQFFANVDGAGRFAAAMAVGAGAMATAFGGGPNIAHDIITRAIDRNVRAQIANQTHGRALVAHQNNFVNTIRGLSSDRAQYGNYVRLGLTAMAKAKMGIEANRLGQTGAQLAVRDEYLKLIADLNAARIQAVTNSAARVTYKIKSMAQGDAILAAKGFATGGTPALASGRRRAGGGGGGTGGGGPRRPSGGGESVEKIVADLNATELAKAEMAKNDDKIDAREMTGEQFVRRAADLLRDRRGGNVSGPDRQALQDELRKHPSGAVQNAANNLRNRDFRAADISVPLGASNTELGFHIQDQVLWDKKGIKEKSKLARAAQAVQQQMEIEKMVLSGGNIAPDIPFLRDILIDQDGNATLSTFFNLSQAETAAKIKQLSNILIKQWHLENAEGTRNALNLEWEKKFAKGGAGLDISLWEFMADFMGSDPFLRVARMGNASKNKLINLRQQASGMGLYTDFTVGASR